MRVSHRLDYIDVCKAIGILFVILGHTYYGPQVLYNLVFCFHLPFFFIVSGFTYNRCRNRSLGFRKYAEKKAKELLLPYLIFAFSNLIIQIVWKKFLFHELISSEYIITNLKGIFFCYSSMAYMPNCSPIWFLVCLFISDILFFLLMKLREKQIACAALLCMSFSYLLSPYTNEYSAFPWKFPVFLMGVFFMYIGYWLRDLLSRTYKTGTNNKSWLIFILLTSGISLELFTGNSVGMNENQYGNIIVFLVTSISISVSLIMICRDIPVLSNNRQLRWLGRNTIYVVGYNYLCRDIAIELYYMTPILRTHKISFIPLFIYSLAVCLLCILICNCIIKKAKAMISK